MRAHETYSTPGTVRTSRLPGFHKLSIDERIDKVASLTGLSHNDVEFLKSSFTGYFPREEADKYIENCIAGCDPPMGIITNAKINGREYLIPLRAEEPSIIAAASRGFLEARRYGVKARSLSNYMHGQIYITSLDDSVWDAGTLNENKQSLLDLANEGHDHTRACDIKVEHFEDNLLLYLLVETGDVQGANVVNQMCEAIVPMVEELTGGKIITGILSNYADQCIAEAMMRIPVEKLARPEHGRHHANLVLDDFLELAHLGREGVIRRATTDNKGVMNGISGVALATGNDWRALEAGAHAYASRTGTYRSLAEWKAEGDSLVGCLRMPIPVGTVRGATGLPFASLGLKILGNPSATELQEIMVSVGLANNFAAIHTLVTDGINRGHLALHKKRFEK
jgi:hydroxymethylglutaryl-CoA reductase